MPWKRNVVSVFKTRVYQILFPLLRSNIDELTAGSDEKTHSATLAETWVFRLPVGRFNHWATKPWQELRANSILAFHQAVSSFSLQYMPRVAWVYNTQRPTKIRWIPDRDTLLFFVWSSCQFFSFLSSSVYPCLLENHGAGIWEVVPRCDQIWRFIKICAVVLSLFSAFLYDYRFPGVKLNFGKWFRERQSLACIHTILVVIVQSQRVQKNKPMVFRFFL